MLCHDHSQVAGQRCDTFLTEMVRHLEVEAAKAALIKKSSKENSWFEWSNDRAGIIRATPLKGRP